MMGSVAVRDGNLVITARGDVSGVVDQNISSNTGCGKCAPASPGAAGTKPCILLWPGTERDVAGKATRPYQIEF
jgi:hypothetical protein